MINREEGGSNTSQEKAHGLEDGGRCTWTLQKERGRTYSPLKRNSRWEQPVSRGCFQGGAKKNVSREEFPRKQPTYINVSPSTKQGGIPAGRKGR